MTVDWRTVSGRYVKDPRLGHRLGRSYPGGEISDAYWNLHWLGTDQDGLIHNGTPVRDFDLADDRVKRIFLFGGSTMMGLGVQSNNLTTAAVLEQLLMRDFPNARVLNCAVGAYMSWHELVYLSLEMIGYNPDMVIVVDGHNDFASSTWGNKGLDGGWIPNTHRSFDDIVQIVLHAVRNDSFVSNLGAAFWKSAAGKSLLKLYTEVTSDGSTAKVSNPVWGDMNHAHWRVKEESVDWYIKNCRSSAGIATFNGAKFVHLLQPQLVAGNRNPTHEELGLLDRLRERMPPIPQLAPQWFERAQPEYHILRDDLHNGRNIWIEDASSMFDHVKETVYHDWVHYNQEGQKLIAERLAQIVREVWAHHE